MPNPNPAIETANLLPQFVHRAPNFPPGAGCRYNNCGYVLVGLMIERATGLSYREVIARDVFGPAGMTDSAFVPMDRVAERVAEGSDPIHDESGAVVGWRRNVYSFPPIGSPDSGALVTAGDLERFMRAVTEGRLMSAGMTSAFLTPQVDYRELDGWSQRFGYGPWFRVESDSHVQYLEKEGINAGVSGMVRHYPARDLTVVILSNLEEGAWEPIDRVHDEVMAGTFD